MFGITLVLFATVRANGAVYAPLAILVVAVLIGRLGFAATLLPHFGTDALWWSFPVGSVGSLALAVLHYRFGDWRRGAMVSVVVEQEAAEQSQATAEPGGRLHPSG